MSERKFFCPFLYYTKSKSVQNLNTAEFRILIHLILKSYLKRLIKGIVQTHLFAKRNANSMAQLGHRLALCRHEERLSYDFKWRHKIAQKKKYRRHIISTDTLYIWRKFRSSVCVCVCVCVCVYVRVRVRVRVGMCVSSEMTIRVSYWWFDWNLTILVLLSICRRIPKSIVLGKTVFELEQNSLNR